jgi:hypothetical protein
MNIGIYFNEKEVEWIKQQPEGYVRKLIQDDMGGAIKNPAVKKGGLVFGITRPEIEENLSGLPIKPVKKGDGLTTCKVCGYMLPYYKGKCKNNCR